MTSNSITEKLIKRFNLLPEIVMLSKRSIDDKLIKAIESNPKIELILNNNPENASDPEKLYHKLVLAFSVEFLEGDIQKIISTYFGGNMWKEWSEDEREQFIDETIQTQKGIIKLQGENKKPIPELDKALYNFWNDSRLSCIFNVVYT